MVYRKKIKAIVYYRVSKKSKNNVRMQRKVCRDYCFRKKIEIVGEYSDKGFSGVSKNRPAFKKLLDEVTSGKVNCVLAYKVDRLGRDFLQLNELMREFSSKGVSLVSATQNFDNFTPEGKFMFRMIAGLAEFESGMISRRTIDGIRAAR